MFLVGIGQVDDTSIIVIKVGKHSHKDTKSQRNYKYTKTNITDS
jgi:hypothetical protein